MGKFVFLPPQDEQTRVWARELALQVSELTVVVADDEADARREIVDADGAFGTLPPDLLARAARLRWLQAPAAGPPAGYYYPALIEHPLVVTNLRGMFNEHIAAHILAFVLAFARGLHRYLPQQLRGEWRRPPENEGMVYLPESTVVIVGLGGIGAETARLCAAFGLTVIGVDARRTDQPEGVSALYPANQLDALLPRADFVILTVPHTPETDGFFDAGRFGRMKPSAFFVNIGRGQTTRLDDLVAILREGRIAGAALDVFEQEPLPPSHPLWTMPNVLMTPHVAGYGPHLHERTFDILVDNAQRFVAGQPLRNVVDKAQWF
jgi:phosphoglycerate dehydrogenase-like enzyme